MAQSECPLCIIPKVETVIYQDDLVYLVSTKDNKSHKVRVMAVTKRHTTKPTFEEQTLIYGILIDYMSNLMYKEDWYIVDSTFATIPQHFHVLACDTPLEDEEDPLFTKTPKVHFPLKEQKILIGIPALNEEKTLPLILAKAKKYGTVVLINDGSTDNTQRIAETSQVDVISHPKRLGYGASITDIFKIAKEENFDILVVLDADNQHDPSEIPQFLKALKTSDVVIGNRFLSNSNIPNYRKLGIKTISKLSGIGDAQCGFRTFNKKAINILANNIYEKGMGASVEILKIAKSHNLKITEIPCTVQYNNKPHSQNPLSHGFDVILALFWSIIWDKPSKTLLPFGLLFLIVTAISGVQTINLYVQSHYVVLSWALFTVGSIICTMLIFNILTFVLVFKNKKD